jgi:hypothetical protein
MRRCVAVLVLNGLAVAALAGCSDDTKDKVKRVASTVQENAGEAGAFALAEALRGALAAKDLPQGQTERTVSVINQVVSDLPGNPDFTGIKDTDGDGVDDDGKVQANLGDSAACLQIARNGDMNVDKGAC